MRHDLTGCRILVVEDDVLLAMDLEMLLERAGCRVIGPAASVDAAIRLLAHQQADGAVLDVNLGSETAFPVADLLADRGIPFVWLSGHSAEMIPSRHSDRPLVGKPYVGEALLAALAATVAPRGPTAMARCP